MQTNPSTESNNTNNNNNNNKNNNNNNIEELGKQTWEALQKLHSQNTPNSERTSADKFLFKYLPNQPCCWQIFSKFLKTDTIPHKAHFFAANMLRSKIQRNLHEVPTQYHIGLHDMILNTLINFNKKGEQYENVRTQLSIALALLGTECKMDPDNVGYDCENVIKRVMMGNKRKVQQLYNQLVKSIIAPTQDINGIKNHLLNLFADIKKCDSFSFTMLHEMNQQLMKLQSIFDDINYCLKKQNNKFKKNKSILNEAIVAVNKRNKALMNQHIDMENLFNLREIQMNIGKLQSKATCILELWNSDNDKQNISKQIDELRELIKNKTDELCHDFESWTFNDVVEWLVFINPKMSRNTLSISEYCRVESDNLISFGDGVISIIFEYQRSESWQLECNNTNTKLYANMMEKFIMIDLNGSKLKGLNDCMLRLVGMEDAKERKIIVKGINNLIDTYGRHKYSKTQLCCTCMMNEVNTCLVPCGHLCYCHECGKRSLNHTSNCPVCRRRILTMVKTYKGGVEIS